MSTQKLEKLSSSKMSNKKKFLIIDSNSIIQRAYHALPPLTTKDGQEIGAVYGFLLSLFKVLKEFRPDFVIATFDFPGPTFRHKEFRAYKAKRPQIPPTLSQQIGKVKEILRIFGIAIFEKKGFEADDLIGTIAKTIARKQIFPKAEIIILSGDFDTLQIVDTQTCVCFPKKGVKETILYDSELVREKYKGLKPSQLVDFKALQGDSSDNIPGIRGIGEKTAIALIKDFGTLENLYSEIENHTEKARRIKPRLRDLLIKYKEDAFFSKKLAKINCDVPIDFNLELCRFSKYDGHEIKKLFEELGFFSLMKRLPEVFGGEGFKDLIK